MLWHIVVQIEVQDPSTLDIQVQFEVQCRGYLEDFDLQPDAIFDGYVGHRGLPIQQIHSDLQFHKLGG